MKNILIFLAILTLPSVIIAQNNWQDVVYLKNGSIIRGMIVEQIPNVSLKIQTTDRSIFVFNFNEIAKITKEENLLNSTNQMSREIQKKQNIHKGLYLGFHVIPGASSVYIQDPIFKAGFNSGVDFDVYFNDHIGIEAGVSFQYLNIYYYYDYGYDPNHLLVKIKGHSINGYITSVGFPIKVIFRIGNKHGFFFEPGLNFYHPLSNKAEDPYNSYSGTQMKLVISEEINLGMMIKASKHTYLKFGLFEHYSLTKYFADENSKGFLFGLNIGFLYKLNQ
jgi:hypothetical protein